jgi:predicted Zn-dependent protease
MSKIAIIVCVLGAAGCGALQQLADNPTVLGAATAVGKGAVQAGAASLPVGYEEERSYGGAIAIEIMQRYGGIYEEPKARAYVALVGETVAMYGGRPDVEYHFAILDSDDVQALSAPGGYVFVTRGALAKMQDEAELAGVLAHEVAHIAARHAVEIIRKMKTQQAATSAVADAWKDVAAFKGLIDGFLGDYLERGLPRDTEFEADKLGTEYLARIGWRANGLCKFLARFGQNEKSGQGGAFSKTHPGTAERVAALDAMLAGLPQDGATNAARFMAAVGPRSSTAAQPDVKAAATGLRRD